MSAELGFSEMHALLAQIAYEDYEFRLFRERDQIYLYARYMDIDVATEKRDWQETRHWPVTGLNKSQFVQTALKLCLTSAEHRVREAFTYRGRRIYGPHIDCDALWDFVGRRSNLDYPPGDSDASRPA